MSNTEAEVNRVPGAKRAVGVIVTKLQPRRPGMR